MKSLIFFIFIVLIHLNIQLQIKIQKKKLSVNRLYNLNAKSLFKVNKEISSNFRFIEQPWAKYFIDPPRSKPCKGNFVIEQSKDKPEVNSNSNLPKSKIYNSNQAKSLSSYMFDFLDQILLKDILENFKTVFEKAKQIIPDEKMIDKYSLKEMFKFDNKAHIDANDIDFITKYIPNYDKDIWENSITMTQMLTIIKEWNWDVIKNPEYAKLLLDKYDYNGDGRLNIFEFTASNIITNIDDNDCTNCYETIKKEKLYPIFTFFDCKAKNKIGAEQIWIGLPNLIRKNEDTCNIFKCEIKGRQLYTNSINDFILKAGFENIGTVNIKEFVKGILIGYLNRQINKKGIVENGDLSEKYLRWTGENLENDTFCDSLNNKVNEIEMNLKLLKQEFKKFRTNSLAKNKL